MKCLLLLWCAAALPAAAQTLRAPDVSFRNEVQRALERGNDFLRTAQHSNGWWSTPDHPSVTALALAAMLGEPQRSLKGSTEVKRGFAFVAGCAKPDGGIYVTNLANYNTSISMMALLASADPRYDGILRRARAYLVGSQIDLGEKGKLDSPFDGGVGYGSKYAHSDMNNTLTALEALHHSRHLVDQKDPAGGRDLDWAAAIHFLESCQNLPARNRQSWVSDNPKDRGGFVYYPGNSMAGGVTNANGKVSLRSYGSISYAGLLSYIYADVSKSDPRVQAVIDWLGSNYSIEENPGMGPQGYFYYLHLMTKALNASGIDTLEIQPQPAGTNSPANKNESPSSRTRPSKVDWRREVAMKLINLQKADGSWQNDNGRWWERDANLVTAYAVLSLEIIHRGL